MSGYTFTSSKPWNKCSKAQLLEALTAVIEQRDKQIARADSNAERAQAAEAELAAARAENEAAVLDAVPDVPPDPPAAAERLGVRAGRITEEDE